MVARRDSGAAVAEWFASEPRVSRVVVRPETHHPLSAPNALADILDRLALPAQARVLDIGGAAYKGEESTAYLTERFGSRIDVVARPDQAAEMTARFGKRIRLLANESEAREGAYDLVVVSPVLGKLVEALLDAGWRGARLLRPGGVIISFGMDPEVLGTGGLKQPEPAMAAAFHAAFGGRPGKPVSLPPALADFYDLLENTPRKPGFRSYLTWMVLRRRFDAGRGSIVEGLGEADGREAARLLRLQDIDTLMVFDPARYETSRTGKFAETMRALGRRLLWVCVGGARNEIAAGPGGGPLLRFPDAAPELDRRLRLIGLTLDAGARETILRDVLAARIGQLTSHSAASGLIVVSQGEAGRRVVQTGLDRLKARHPGAAAQVRWLHDVLDPRLDAASAAPPPVRSRQPDAATAASTTAQRGIPAAERLPDVQRMADRFAYRGKSLRQKLEITGQLLIYSGIGQGANLARLAEVLTAAPDVRLASLAGRTSTEAKALRRAAQRLEADERLHLLPVMKSADIPGFIADADIGIIGVDAQGRPEPDELLRLSGYLLAGVPVLAPAGGEAAALLGDWPVGLVYAGAQDGALAAAAVEALARRAELASAIARRPDLMLSLAWDTQAARLRDILGRLGARPRVVRSGAA